MFLLKVISVYLLVTRLHYPSHYKMLLEKLSSSSRLISHMLLHYVQTLLLRQLQFLYEGLCMKLIIVSPSFAFIKGTKCTFNHTKQLYISFYLWMLHKMALLVLGKIKNKKQTKKLFEYYQQKFLCLRVKTIVHKNADGNRKICFRNYRKINYLLRQPFTKKKLFFNLNIVAYSLDYKSMFS